MKSRRDALIELTAALIIRDEPKWQQNTTVVTSAVSMLDKIDEACGYENLCPDCDGEGSCQSAMHAGPDDFDCDGACARCGGVGFVAWEAPPNGGPMLGEENS